MNHKWNTFLNESELKTVGVVACLDDQQRFLIIHLICKVSSLLFLGQPKPKKHYFLTTEWTGQVNVDNPNPETDEIEHDDYRWATIEEIKDIDNSEIPIYLLEKALEMSKNE
jgi:hypothetical protein